MMNLPHGLMLLDLFASSLVVLGLLRLSCKLGLARAPMLAGSLVFLVGMLPWGDQLARFSIWLHSLQSVAIHHLAPMLWMLAFAAADRSCAQQRATHVPALSSALLLAFALFSWAWMLPSLHRVMMHDAGLYMLMRWAMALSGLALVFVAWQAKGGRRSRSGFGVGPWINLVMSGPMVAWGVAMLVMPDLYSSIHSPMGHSMMMAAVPDYLSLPMMLDQRLGGFIFLLFGLTCLAMGYRPLARVAEGVSPKSRRYS